MAYLLTRLIARIIFTLPLLAAVELFEVEGPNGQKAFINTHEVSSLRQPTSAELQRSFPPNTKCVVVMTNSKFIASIETCSDLRQKMTGEQH